MTISERELAETSKITVVPRRRWGVSAFAVAVAAVAAGLVYVFVTTPNIDWAYVEEYLFDSRILHGVFVTIELSLISMAIGTVLGVGVGIMRLSTNPVLSSIAFAYTTVVRGIPALLLVLLWGNIALLIQVIDIGVARYDTNDVVTPFLASVIAFTMATGAYTGEIVRGGVLSVDQGQVQAAAALGMGPGRTMRRIVLPQALRVIIPPLGNQFIDVIKGTSVVVVVAGGDLLTEAQNVSATSYRVLEMLLVSAFWYLVLIGFAGACQSLIERRLARGRT